MTGPRIKHTASLGSGESFAKVDTLLADMARLFSSAALAHSRHAPDAAARTRDALNAIEAVRLELHRLGEREKP